MKLYLLFLALVFAFHNLPAQQSQNFLATATPESRNYSSTFLARLGNDAGKQVPSLASFLVWKHDALIYEGYFHGAKRNTAFDVKSVTKSVMSAIVGAAVDRGYLHNLDTLVLDFFPEYVRHYPVHKDFDRESWEDADSALHQLSLRHLLTMQTGFDFFENSPVAHAYSNSSDPVRFTLDLGFTDDPGEKFNYCSPAAHLCGAVIARLIKTDLRDFADSTLFIPLGIMPGKWEVDAKGRHLGASGLELTAQDMIRFGILYLKGGKVDGKQVLSEAWIKESTSQHVVLNNWDVLPGANGYGYYWWRRHSNGLQVYVASGYGGQLICVVPDLELVVTTTCTLGENNRGRSEIKRLHLLIDKIVAACIPKSSNEKR